MGPLFSPLLGPPGDYSLEVQVSTRGEDWGDETARLDVRVAPRFFETLPFRIAVLVAMVGGVALLVSLRSRGARRRQAELRRVVEERTRELRDEVVERERVEERLREAGQELESEVERRTIELKSALRELELDVERRLGLEQRLRQAEKLESVGKLAAGIAHDFNNVLTVVVGECELAMAAAQRNSGERAINAIENALRSVDRAKKLTHQLLAFSQSQVLHPTVIDPLEVTRGLSRMLERLVRDDTRIVFDEASRSSSVLMDSGQLEQVVVNLVVNASEAMPDGGTVRLSTSIVDPNRDPVAEAVEGGYCVLAVADDGPGLDEADREAVFDPFFSTKGPARGMGLASVTGIVQQSGGHLELETRLGEGSTFHIYLPSVLEVAEELDEPAADASELEADLSVLLVDDEEAVRETLQEMLESLEVQVRVASTPSDALEIVREGGHAIDVLLTDVVMPEMNGRRLAEEVREVSPDVKVLYMSGYSDDHLAEGLGESARFLRKPFRRSALVECLAQLVG